MAILIKQFKVRFKNKTYGPGEIIIGLSQKDEADLVSKGYAEYAIMDRLEDQEESDESDKEETLGEEDSSINEHDETEDGENLGENLESVKDLNVSLDTDEYIEPPKTKK